MTTKKNEDGARIHAVAAQFMDAWSSHDLERVLALYTEDVEYNDPNLAAAIHGAASLERYLTRLFDEWWMSWELGETLPMAAGDSAAVMWRAQFRRVTGDRTVMVQGVDLVMLRGNRIRRNDVFFDRTPLAELGAASGRELRTAPVDRTR